MSDDFEPDTVCVSDVEDNEPDIPNPVSFDFAEESSQPSPYVQQTRRLKSQLEASHDTAIRVRDVLEYMETRGLNLALLLDALSWRDPELLSDGKAKFARNALMLSDELPGILRRWHRPPRVHNRGIKTKAAHKALTEWAFDCIGEQIDHEMETLASDLHSPREDLSSDSLLDVKFQDLNETVKSRAPTVKAMFARAATTRRQAKINTAKDPEKAILYMVCHASFTRSHHRNKLHKLLAIYMRSCGMSAKSFDTLHAFGLTMSQKWTYDAIDVLSESSREALLEDVHRYLFSLSHDNLNIGFTTAEQRIGHHSHFDSGTAGTVFIVKDADAPHPDNPELKKTRTEGGRTPISGREILSLEDKASKDLHSRAVHRVLRFALEAKEFGFHTYHGRKDARLKPPAPVDELPCGPDHRTTQYMLNTKHMEEASYEGNDRLIEEFFRQLKFGSPEELKRTGLERVIVWIGDQLTVSRLRGLANFRAEDFNSYDRMDWLVPQFGWFHLQMAFGNSLHNQYYGSRASLGLVHAFDLLDRRGLSSTATKGPFHHNLDEALYHIGEAHFRDLWRKVGGVDKIADLRRKSPEELLAIAEKIVSEHASTNALRSMDRRPEKDRDQLRRQMMQFNRDVLDYYELDEAIKVGDVGRMENMLPRLLFRFAGGRNGNYAGEVLELLQALNKEWSPETKAFVRRYGWLGNMSGHRNGFCPIDKIQEHNVRDIKATFAAIGPNASWDYIGRISGAIPFLRTVKDHVEAQFNPFSRYKKHTMTAKEEDVSRLSESYARARAHEHRPGRALRSAGDKVSDYTAKGVKLVVSNKLSRRWWENRVHERSTEEDWEDIFDPVSD